MSKPVKRVNNTTLANAVSDALGWPRNARQDKGYQVVTTLIKVLSEALQRGDRVKLDGLGIFELRTTPGRKRSVWIYQDAKTRVRGVIDYPPVTKVIFKPSKTLNRALNEGNPPNAS